MGWRGFVVLSTGFAAGALTIGVRNWFAERYAPYLDRNEAISFAADEAKAICRDDPPKPGVDCRRYRLTSASEVKEGWIIKLTSIDKRRVETQFIGRRGEYDDIATVNPLSDDAPGGVTRLR